MSRLPQTPQNQPLREAVAPQRPVPRVPSAVGSITAARAAGTPQAPGGAVPGAQGAEVPGSEFRGPAPSSEPAERGQGAAVGDLVGGLFEAFGGQGAGEPGGASDPQGPVGQVSLGPTRAEPDAGEISPQSRGAAGPAPDQPRLQDQVSLPSSKGNGSDDRYSSVTVLEWGGGKDDSVWNALQGAGYTDAEIAQGGLVDQVARLNGLDDSNRLHPGEQIRLPRKGGPDAAANGGSLATFGPRADSEGASPSLSLGPGEQLKQGSQGDKVRALQEMLKSRGANLEVDGEFGPQTQRAVLDFQNRSGLEGDGIVGPETLGALNGARPTPPVDGAGKDGQGNGSLQQDVMGRARSIGGQINATGGYRFDGSNDCYGFVRRVWDPVLQGMGKGNLPVSDGPNSSNWGRVADWNNLRPGDVLSTAQGHQWGDQWHGGLYAGKINGVHYIYDNSGGRGAQLRPLPNQGYFTHFYRPTHDLLAGG